MTCTGRYVLTQDDLDLGSVTNTATVSATSPTGATVTSPSDTTTSPLVGQGGLRLVKTAGTPTVTGGADRTRTDAGDTVAYTFTLTNTGSLSLDRLSVTDDTLAAAVTCPTDGPLAPGSTVTCTASATLTQADLDRGSVTNTATATAVDSEGRTQTSAASSVTTTLSPVSSLTVDKAAAASDASGDDTIGVGDTVDYTFLVTNTGTTTITAVAVADSRITGSVACPVTTLLPGASTTCTASYTVTAADDDAGSVTNTARATGSSPTGTSVTSPSDTVDTPVGTPVALALVKRAGTPVDVDDNGTIGVGDTIAYTFTVTNTGGRDLLGVAVADPKAGAVTCAATTLAPLAVTECAATTPYVITQADVDAGSVDNRATASGATTGGRPVISDPATTSTTVTAATPGVELEKTAGPVDDRNGDGRDDAGDRLRYAFHVTNTGTATLTALAVVDPMLDDAGVAVSCPTTTLAPGESTDCVSGYYTLTDADEQAGTVVNVASVSARYGRLGIVAESNRSAATVTVQTTPGGNNNGGNDNGGNDDGGNDDGGNHNGDLAGTGAPFGPELPVLGFLLLLSGGLVLSLANRGKKPAVLPRRARED